MKIKKWLSVLLAVCMLLDLAPAIALARHQDRGWEFPDLWEGAEPAAVSEPSRYTVVFRFDETENGSVVIVSGANQNSSTGEYTASGGSTVTLAPVPDEGYRYKSGSIRVYYRESGSEIDVPVDEETFSFVVPDVRAYVRLYAEFEPFTPPPEPHSIGVYYQSGEPTGNTVEVDREPDHVVHHLRRVCGRGRRRRRRRKRRHGHDKRRYGHRDRRQELHARFRARRRRKRRRERARL